MMKKNLSFRIFFLLLVSVFSIYIGLKLSPHTNPMFYGLPKISDSEAEQIAQEFLQNLGVNPNEYHEYSYFQVAQSGSNYIINNLGMEKFKQMMEDVKNFKKPYKSIIKEQETTWYPKDIYYEFACPNCLASNVTFLPNNIAKCDNCGWEDPLAEFRKMANEIKAREAQSQV